ncbi:MAG TPA: ABC transporter permease, partial [Gemmataceae bacterium]|nr:ABC transporter permease [Gemmataceae bacterium]
MDPVPPPSPAPADRNWPLRLAGLAWIGVGAAGWYFAGGLPFAAQLVLAVLWVVGMGLVFRTFVVSLFGPVLAYDVLRAGRKKWAIYARVTYAIVLTVIFVFTYATWYSFATRFGGPVQPKHMSRLAENYFAAYMVVQFILVCLLTPAAVAGAIADEKERRTLEFLLATDLRDREILFGKLASRVGALLLFLVAGVPVLSAIQFFGGIEPDYVLAGFTATFSTVLVLAALSIAASVLAKRARDAIVLTYLAAFAYVVLSILAHAVALSPAFRAETAEVFGYTVAPPDVTYPFVAGNPFWMVPETLDRQARGGSLLFDAVGHYVLFDAVVVALLVGWAGLRLRAIALGQAFGGPKRPLFLRRKPKEAGRPTPPAAGPTRPELGDAPVVWKEVFVDSGLKLGLFGKIMVYGLVVCSFVPVFIIF